MKLNGNSYSFAVSERYQEWKGLVNWRELISYPKKVTTISSICCCTGFLLLLQWITTNLMLKTTKFITLQMLKTKSPKWGYGVKIRVLEGEILGQTLSLAFHLPLVALIPNSWSIFKANNHVISVFASDLFSLILTILPPSLTNKEPCDNIGPKRMLQANLTISRFLPSSHLQSLSSYKET